MNYRNIFSMCAAVAVTFVEFAVVTQPVSARSRTVVVTAPAETVTRRVSFADLNLATAPGEQALNRRVGGAVNSLCAEATGGPDGSLRLQLAMKSCSSEAWSGARPQIARAVQRAREVAATGSSSIAAAAITIALPH